MEPSLGDTERPGYRGPVASAGCEGRKLTPKKTQSSFLPTPGGMPRILTQPSWKGTVDGSTTGATLGLTRLGLTPPPREEFSAAIPLMPGGSGGPPAACKGASAVWGACCQKQALCCKAWGSACHPWAPVLHSDNSAGLQQPISTLPHHK